MRQRGTVSGRANASDNLVHVKEESVLKSGGKPSALHSSSLSTLPHLLPLKPSPLRGNQLAPIPRQRRGRWTLVLTAGLEAAATRVNARAPLTR
jgi:hypothetical protein